MERSFKIRMMLETFLCLEIWKSEDGDQRSIESDPSNIFFGTITYDVQDAGTYKYYFQEVSRKTKNPAWSMTRKKRLSQSR